MSSAAKGSLYNQVKWRRLFTKRQNYNIVSLGFFCSVASECERIGVRTTSLPFDWLITDSFERVLFLIENRFSGFLTKDNLQQEVDVNPKYYYDPENCIHYYHDFKLIQPFDDEYISVREKYDKRIHRFYDIISEPTIFIRYVCSDKEMRFIEDNYNYVNSVLKSFNSDNVIYFILNKDFAVYKEIPNLFFVDKDNNDNVARKFLEKVPDLSNDLVLKSKLSKRQIRQNKCRAINKNTEIFL